MTNTFSLSRRALIGYAAVMATGARAASPIAVKVFKDPGCGCCNGWIEHLRANGFAVTSVDSAGMTAVKQRLGVPAELASCHTAEVDGYVIEGHVPAKAIRRLLEVRLQAIGLSAPGMPMGSPGMEGGKPEIYEIVLFGKDQRVSFGRFKGADPV